MGIHANSGSKKSSLLWFNFLVAARAVHVFSFGSDPAATNAKPDCSSKTGTHFADCSAPCLAHDSTTVQVHFLRPIVTDENHVQAGVGTGCPVTRAFGSLFCGRLDFQMLKSASAESCALSSRSLPMHRHTTCIQAMTTQVLCSTCELALGTWLQNAGFKIMTLIVKSIVIAIVII